MATKLTKLEKDESPTNQFLPDESQIAYILIKGPAEIRTPNLRVKKQRRYSQSKAKKHASCSDSIIKQVENVNET